MADNEYSDFDQFRSPRSKKQGKAMFHDIDRAVKEPADKQFTTKLSQIPVPFLS